jgi:FkbM family methyltransferase
MFKSQIVPKIDEELSVFDYYNISNQEKNDLLKFSKSQLQQDIFVYLASNRKKNGFFVEFGATDGINLSNSYLLEKAFGWKGILAEPALVWHEKLKNNRPDAMIETSCVWVSTGEKLLFNEPSSPELATVDAFSSSDDHANARKEGKKIYEVSTISLVDLLKKHNAPKDIDYLSIDTEGSELEILTAFFIHNTYYKIKIITCEHNFTKNREKIYTLLVNNGYKRKGKLISKWDDFYVLQDNEPSMDSNVNSTDQKR